MDFIFDPSLVLYLPLYKLDGASFMSRDAYGHLCTVTGAVWTPQGRDFDGADDWIDLGTPTSLQITNLTIIAWVKRGATGAAQMIIASAINGWGFYFGPTDNLRFGKIAASEVLGSGTITDTSEFHQVGITYDSSNAVFFIDGEIDTTVAYADPSFASTQKGVGIRPDDLSGDFDGLIPELWVYRRASTPLEFQHNYLATKWRYR